MRAAIVTGSDSGIGKATAVALARAGHDVGITWHEDEGGARDTARQVESTGRRAERRIAGILSSALIFYPTTVDGGANTYPIVSSAASVREPKNAGVTCTSKDGRLSAMMRP